MVYINAKHDTVDSLLLGQRVQFGSLGHDRLELVWPGAVTFS